MTEKQSPCRAYMQCGAFFRAKRIYGTEDGFVADPKTGRFRVTVYNGNGGCQRPRHERPDGKPEDAECFACKCRRASGRKEQQVFVTDEKGEIVPNKFPVPLITCLIARQVELGKEAPCSPSP